MFVSITPCEVCQVAPEEYAAAAPDPVYEFSQPVAGHMNADHAKATAAIVKLVTGMGVDSAKILTIDRLGMNVQCSREGQTFKCRVPFTRWGSCLHCHLYVAQILVLCSGVSRGELPCSCQSFWDCLG